MEGEIVNYIKAWLQVIPSLSYCFLVGKLLPPSRPFLRLFLMFPVFSLFLYLPLNLHSLHLGGTFAFFIAWLANSKLFLFAFNKGPLSLPPLSLPRFIALASLPIKFQQTPEPTSHNNNDNNQKGQKSLVKYGIKGLVLAGIVRSYEYKQHFHTNLVLTLYSIHIYLTLEIILVVFAAVSRTLTGVELEPQFNEPYLSSSPQDFWGRRWNIMASRILRPTVYEPVYSVCLHMMGRKWASLPAVFATFLASGLIHELIFYYLGRVRPTWEITWFFILHGFCLVVEIELKKRLSRRLRLPKVILGPLTVGFVLVTAFRLFFPQFLRCKGDERGLQEYVAAFMFLKNVTRSLTLGASWSL
ncbi:acyl-CoA--sterol O-acyltransferase 1-like [Prosopis cineraria]|uniref:acyl-CoA--sterol O-acyltransferase 1-like n=1 Tax=Prosopis cineraria TaxID=364024 RepID=UPI0024100F2B|nr:acyl-CoA--sterol O-acyltransferase 1-like [Prosopis cineraria]